MLLVDNSLILASNIRLYRSEFFEFISEPEALGPEYLGLEGYILHPWKGTVVDQTRKADQYPSFI